MPVGSASDDDLVALFEEFHEWRHAGFEADAATVAARQERMTRTQHDGWHPSWHGHAPIRSRATSRANVRSLQRDDSQVQDLRPRLLGFHLPATRIRADNEYKGKTVNTRFFGRKRVVTSAGIWCLAASIAAAQAAPRRPGARLIPRLPDRVDVIAFCSDRDGDFEVYLMDADGGNVRQLTHNDADEWVPTWSPDGTQLTFVSQRDGNYELYVMNADGSGVTRLTETAAEEYDPAWSPDGSRIAFWSDVDGDREIYVINRDGSGLHQLTDNSLQDDAPDWSPDGSRILFHSHRNNLSQVYVMNADGSDQRAMTRGHLPDWSQDGMRVTFESLRDGPLEIYSMDSHGGNVQRLTFTDTDNHEPGWSPDGTRIIYVSNHGVSSENYEIIVMDANGGNEVNLTNHAANDMGPVWRPVVPAEEVWDRTFGGSLADWAQVIRRTRDGGFIVGGGTVSYSDGGSDLWLNKLDHHGRPVWDQIFGGASDDDVLSIQELDDGYVVAGMTESYGSGDEDFWLIKTTGTGTEVWSRTFGGAAQDRGQSVQQTPDGGFVIAGKTMSFGSGRQDAWLIRTDRDGHEIWNRTYGAEWDDDAYTVLAGDDGGFVLCGHRGTADGEFDVWIAGLDDGGAIVWEQTFGAPGWDNAYSCIATADGGYALAGYTESPGDEDLDVWLVKTDSQGTLVWDSVFRGTGRDTAFSIRETRDGGFIISGSSTSYGDGDSDIWLGRTDSAGNFLWTRTVGGEQDDFGFGLDLIPDGGYVVAGSTDSFGGSEGDGYVVRLRREIQPQPPEPATKGRASSGDAEAIRPKHIRRLRDALRGQ
jgi:hypothetical protein